MLTALPYSLCTGNCPEKVIVLSSLEGELHDDAFISYAHKTYWDPWVAKSVQLIQKRLRLTADQAFVLFIANSPSRLTLGRGWVNPGVKLLHHQIRPSGVDSRAVSH